MKVTRFGVEGSWRGIAALVTVYLGALFGLLAFGANSAEASRSTYTRRFVNRTSVPLSVYLFDFEASRWDWQFTVYPGIPVIQREVPRRGLESRRLLWGMDVGADGAAIDLMKNDFGTADWRFQLGER